MIKVAGLGLIVNVTNDGNCGYHSFRLGLEDISKTDEFKTVIGLRYKLYWYGEMSFENLRHYEIYDTIPEKYRERAVTYENSKILSWTFDTGVNFEGKVKYQYWLHGVETSAIACDLLQVGITIYSLPYPNTLAFIYLDEDIIHRQIFNKNISNIMEDYENKKPSIYMIYTPGHYKFHKRNNN